ncbi:MAG: putative flagellar protein FliT [Burkholderia sp.]|jgi:flagellar protein FliT|nr:putative flagellar protein FliT [Burkholderia sp.]
MPISSEDVIGVYENVSQLTRQMLAAARSRDWDTLHRLERDCASQVSLLREGQPPSLTGELRARKVRLLQSILADDREIRNITEPWMDQLSLLMQGPRTGAQSRRNGHSG